MDPSGPVSVAYVTEPGPTVAGPVGKVVPTVAGGPLGDERYGEGAR